MKFLKALIYALAATLLMGLLVVYFYFSVLQQQASNPADSSSANLTLLLFVNAVLVFALILIWLESSNDNTPQSPLEEYIAEVKKEEKKDEQVTEKLEPLLQRLNQISKSVSLTNKTLNLGLERLSSRIDDIENASIDRIASIENNVGSDNETHPELKEIFNDELAQTLSGLEIMQDSNKKSPLNEKFEDVDLDTLLDNK